MEVGTQYIYLIATGPLLVIWLWFYVKREDLHREMLSMSLLIGILSVATSYYWWTIDWWRPLTITGTRVGVEDFLMGFGMGGVISIIYEVVSQRKYSKRHAKTFGYRDFFLILFLLAQTTSWLFYGVGLSSFLSSTIAMMAVAVVMLSIRKDLMVNAFMSGLLTMIVSGVFYATAIFLSPEWVADTYVFSSLSKVLILNVPIEEFIFWFLAGMVFGPFYEFWKGIRLGKLAYKNVC